MAPSKIKKYFQKKSIKKNAVKAIKELNRQAIANQKIGSNAVQAIQRLQKTARPSITQPSPAKLAMVRASKPQKPKPAITTPSPAKLAMVRASKPIKAAPLPLPMKGPSRPPPPPPSTIPSRPFVGPKLPAKPMKMPGVKLK